MGTGEERLDRIGAMGFRGKVGHSVASYSRAHQEFAHDVAAELDVRAELAYKAMLKLRKHPRLKSVHVRLRARLVARHLKRCRSLAQGISAEMVAFHLQYRREFLEVDERNSGRGHSGDVDL